MKRILFISLIILIIAPFANGQRKGPPRGDKGNGGVLKGIVKDADDNTPIEYANITLRSAKDSTIVTGGISDTEGRFLIKEVPFGIYIMEADFIGYKKQTGDKLMITPRKPVHKLGVIRLQRAAEMLEEVSVEADRKHIDYKIDRKVVNVSQDIAASGGNAVDILENTPSIQTDIEGNVQLRGSSSFTVLIDGKPTPLEGSEALQQLPASAIESIEIITNPSAKFDPDGTAGIINIIMKEEQKKGINGNFNLSYGSFNAFNGDFLVNARQGKFNFFVGGKYSDRQSRGESESDKATFGSDSTFVTDINGENTWGHKGYNARAGLDFFMTDNDIFTVSGELGSRGFLRGGENKYHLFYSDDTVPGFSNDYGWNQYYLNNADFEVEGKYLSADLNYQHKFNDEGHDLQAYVYYSRYDKEENSGYEQIYTDADFNELPDPLDKERSVDSGANNKMRGKIDYTYPFSEVGKFEAGYQYRHRRGLSDYTYEIWDNGVYVPDPTQTSDFDFNRHVQALYSTFTNRLVGFDFMLGLRAEYTTRLFESVTMEEKWDFEKFDLFPSVHLSRKMGKGIQLQASYSRRVRRPRGWFLDPFKSKMDEYNYHSGNPNLKPAYIDSYELNLQKRLGKHFIALETFYRKTHDKFERLIQPDSDNPDILVHTWENVGSDQAYGVEMMGNFNFTGWWNFNLTGELYQYTLDAVGDNVSTGQKSSLTYSGRMKSTFKLKKTNTRFELSGMYRSPSVTAQGERGDFFMINGAVRQDFFDRKLSVMLSLKDIFGTYAHEHESVTEDFYTYHSFDMISPIWTITLTYTLNDYERRKEEHDSVEIESGGMM